MGWLNEVLPDNEQWQKFTHGVSSMTEKFKDSIEIGELHHHPVESIFMSICRSAFETTRRGQDEGVAALVRFEARRCH